MKLPPYLLALALVPTPAAMFAQAKVAAPSEGLVVHLEQYRAGKVVPVRPEHVFEANDYLRFRLQTPSHGYLYVIDQGSSGDYSVLFPSAQTQASNEIGTAPEMFVPSPADGWFQVGGPAGFDTVYFLLSPTPLSVSAKGVPLPGRASAPPANLLPRCNDAIFQSRGECVDNSAGPSVLPRDAPLPPQITTAAPTASRDLFLADENTETVKAGKPLTGPAVYAFRIAHK